MSEDIERESFLLPFEERFGAALRTWDPLPDCPLLKWLDPIDTSQNSTTASRKIRLPRFLSFILVGAPPLLLSLMPSRTAGGGFWSERGMHLDFFHFFAQWLMFPCLTFILLYGRRALGDMVNRVSLGFGVPIPVLRRRDHASRLLRFLERISRVTFVGSLVWILVFEAENLSDYIYKLKSTSPLWLTSPAMPGTWFYFLRVGTQQPNFAGIYAQFFGGVLIAYVILALGRLVVEFSLCCSQLATVLRGHIMPAHPDNVGGLMPVGRVALVLSLPIMLIGFSQTVVTLQEALIWKKEIAWVVLVWWLLYLLLCPLLFLLPVLPLRRLMYESKNAYLLRLEELYRSFDTTAPISTGADRIKASTIADQFAVVQLIERVSAMSVWPYDKRTFLRFGSIVIAPVLPLLANQTPNVLKKAVHFLLH